MSKPPKKKSKYRFLLPDVDVNQVNARYGIELATVDEELSDPNPADTTRLTQLDTAKGTPEVISFLDEAKVRHTCYVSMVDFASRMNVNLLRYHCYWCRSPFETRPIGCPIKYVASQAVKKYHSHISRDTYTIKESIPHNKTSLDAPNISIKIGEYYETDGVFCSFNCCQAFINDNHYDRKYTLSNMLLMKMYNTMMGTKVIRISPAPHWRTLDLYGGHMNILAFRDGFNKVDYESHGNTRPVPRFEATGTLYEEKIKF